jgi:hypothetical protein
MIAGVLGLSRGLFRKQHGARRFHVSRSKRNDDA